MPRFSHVSTFFEAKMDAEQRFAIKYLVRKKKTRQETLCEIQEVYGTAALQKTAIYKWYKRFSEGYSSAADLPRTGRHGTLSSKNNVLKVKTLVDHNRRITVRELASCLDLSVGNVHRILHKQLGMRRVAARWIPRLLDKDQKQARVKAAQCFLQRFHKEGQQFLDRIVTVDETWVSTFDPETKQSSSMWKTPSSPSPQKARVCRSHKKQMFIVFYDTEGVILCHGVPVGRTINSEYYQQVNGIVKFVEIYKTFFSYGIKY